MTVLLDHLAAIVVGTFLLGAIAVFLFRAQSSAAEATDQYRATAQAGELATTLERELENVRSRSQTEQAFALTPGMLGFSADEYRFRLQRDRTADGTVYTSQIAFPTLADPSAGTASEVHVVAYEVTPTGETARVDGQERALLKATRYTFARGGPLRETVTFDRLVDFDATVVGSDGAETRETPELQTRPAKITVAFRHAPAPTLRAAGDASVASVRHVRTVRVPGAGASAALSVDDSRPGGIPDLPGDDSYDPTREPVPTYDPDAEPDATETAGADLSAPEWGGTGVRPGSDGGTGTGGGTGTDTGGGTATDSPAGSYDPAEWQDDRRDPEASVPLCRAGTNILVLVGNVGPYVADGYSRGECHPPGGGGVLHPSEMVVVCMPLSPGSNDYDPRIVQWRDTDRYVASGGYRGECRVGDDP